MHAVVTAVTAAVHGTGYTLSMGYPTCSLVLDKNLRKPLPVRFLEPDEVRRRLEAGEDPVTLSLDKWQRILTFTRWLVPMPKSARYYSPELTSDRLGATSCALCLVATKKHYAEVGPTRTREDKCQCCPLSGTNQCTKPESLFARFQRSIDQPHVAAVLAAEMIDAISACSGKV